MHVWGSEDKPSFWIVGRNNWLIDSNSSDDFHNSA